MFLFLLQDVPPLEIPNWLIGVAALALVAFLWWRAERRIAAECGPGCICGGENRVRAEQNVAVYVQQPNYPPPSQPALPPQPQIIYLQAPAQQQLPQIQYLPAHYPPQATYPQALPVHYPQRRIAPPRVQYLPAGYEQHYPAPEHVYYTQDGQPIVEYQPETHYLPPSRPIAQLPPPTASQIRAAAEKGRVGR